MYSYNEENNLLDTLLLKDKMKIELKIGKLGYDLLFFGSLLTQFILTSLNSTKPVHLTLLFICSPA